MHVGAREVEPPGVQAQPPGAVPGESCNDALLNQNEEQVDCGGVCRGFWYDGKCNAAPKPECASDADCGAGRECLAGKCVAKPECAADADCAAGEECKAGQCEKKPLSGALDITITSVHVAPGSATLSTSIFSQKLNWWQATKSAWRIR